MRLQKYMAECGVASRRKCEEIIAAGRVTVNGKVVDVMGAQVEEGDAVCVDGAPIRAEQRRQYILLNKPQGVVTTLSDPQGRRTVRDLIDGIPERIYPVGRLENGLTLDDGHRTARAKVTLLPEDPAYPGLVNLRIAVHEGHNRLVRRMFEAVGARVVFLRRERIGQLTLGHLKTGAWRHLTDAEVAYLRTLGGSDEA